MAKRQRDDESGVVRSVGTTTSYSEDDIIETNHTLSKVGTDACEANPSLKPGINCCAVCAAVAGDAALSTCGTCRRVSYCSVQHQAQDAAVHRRVCPLLHRIHNTETSVEIGRASMMELLALSWSDIVPAEFQASLQLVMRTPSAKSKRVRFNDVLDIEPTQTPTQNGDRTASATPPQADTDTDTNPGPRSSSSAPAPCTGSASDHDAARLVDRATSDHTPAPEATPSSNGTASPVTAVANGTAALAASCIGSPARPATAIFLSAGTPLGASSTSLSPSKSSAAAAAAAGAPVTTSSAAVAGTSTGSPAAAATAAAGGGSSTPSAATATAATACPQSLALAAKLGMCTELLSAPLTVLQVLQSDESMKAVVAAANATPGQPLVVCVLVASAVELSLLDVWKAVGGLNRGGQVLLQFVGAEVPAQWHGRTKELSCTLNACFYRGMYAALAETSNSQRPVGFRTAPHIFVGFNLGLTSPDCDWLPTLLAIKREFDGHCQQRQSLPASHRGPVRRARLPLLLCANTLVEASMERELLLLNNWVTPQLPAEPLRNPFGSLLPSQSDTLANDVFHSNAWVSCYDLLEPALRRTLSNRVRSWLRRAASAPVQQFRRILRLT
ncbi:MAG: hypothetical protein WDW38_001601 [Sanguina aurantia]